MLFCRDVSIPWCYVPASGVPAALAKLTAVLSVLLSSAITVCHLCLCPWDSPACTYIWELPYCDTPKMQEARVCESVRVCVFVCVCAHWCVSMIASFGYTLRKKLSAFGRFNSSCSIPSQTMRLDTPSHLASTSVSSPLIFHCFHLIWFDSIVSLILSFCPIEQTLWLVQYREPIYLTGASLTQGIWWMRCSCHSAILLYSPQGSLDAVGAHLEVDLCLVSHSHSRDYVFYMCPYLLMTNLSTKISWRHCCYPSRVMM